MREVETIVVLRLRMAISLTPGAVGIASSPVSSAQSCNAADMLPQFTLQSIVAVSAAACASSLTRRTPPGTASIPAKNTLLEVGVPRPSPVVCRFAATSPDSGRPVIRRTSSSRSGRASGTNSSHSTIPVEVPPRI